jgi:ribose transport system substrate-binding protein
MSDENDPIEIGTGLSVHDLSRRDFLTSAAKVGGAMAIGGALAACAAPSSSSPAATSAASAPAATTAVSAAPSAVASAPASLDGRLADQLAGHFGVIFEHFSRGNKEMAKQFGLNPPDEFVYDADNSKMFAQIDQMGTLGVNMMSTLILDNGTSRQVAEAAVKNNLYMSTYAQVGLWIMPCEPAIDYHYQCLANPPDGAYTTCVNMFKKLNGVGNFAHITGSTGSATSRAKDKAIDRAVAQFPGIKMVARQVGNYDRNQSQTVMDAICTANDNKIDAVFCQNDDSAMGALAALRNRGLNGKTLLGGADGIPEMMDAIIAGEAFGTEGIAAFFGQGYCAVQTIDAYHGHKADPIEGLMQMDFLMIDNKASAQSYKDIVFGSTPGEQLFDYKKMSRLLHPDDWDPQWPIRTADPDTFWAQNQGVPKPDGYELPDVYKAAVAAGGHEAINALYRKQLKNFVLLEIARKSSTGKTMFEQVYGDNFG